MEGNGEVNHNSVRDLKGLDESDESYRRMVQSLHKALRQEVIFNVETYKSSGRDSDSDTVKLYNIFCELYGHLENVDSNLLEILESAHEYDFRNQKINGYRSTVKVVMKCMTKLEALVRHISVSKRALLFRKGHYIRELEAYVMVMGQLRDVVAYTRKLIDYSARGHLIPSESLLDSKIADEIQIEMDRIDQEWFYGRALGFQFCESLRRTLGIIHVSLASYSHNYDSCQSPYVKLAGSLFTGSQYAMNPESRAQKVVEVTLGCDIQFCKAFWNLSESEVLTKMANLALPKCPINHVFKVDTKDLMIETVDGRTVMIKSPSAHIGRQPLQLRLISHKYRVGQKEIPGFPYHTPKRVEPPSKYLIIQCHGGGFVSQTSKTHEAYLRCWAKDLDVPVLCIDYSLAPAAPFPRALEEVYYAYAWALKNKRMLGSTAERIAIVGDSAGGNLLLAAMLKAIEDGIRLPDGIVPIYTPVYIQFIPSPSRSLSVMDPLLPVGILTKCLEAYAGDHIEPWRNQKHPVTSLENGSPSVSSEPRTPPEFNEEDDEIKQLLDCPALHSSKSESIIEDTKKFASFNQPIESKIDAEEATGAKDATNLKLTLHKRDSYKSHTRSESLPMSPKFAPIDITARNDKNRHLAQSPLYKFSKIRIRQDPFLSPLFASDELLSKMPSTYIVGAHLDPCLDDSVSFAKRLDSLGVDVHLDAVDDVPHGFLNFALVSDECMQATEVCRDKLRLALRMDEEDDV